MLLRTLPSRTRSTGSGARDVKSWGLKFVSLFDCVTPYIHLFVAHSPQYLRHYGSLGRFGNWAAEGLHSTVKYVVLHNSPRAGGKGQQGVSFYAMQWILMDRHLESILDRLFARKKKTGR